MSRTVRNRTKSGELTNYGFHKRKDALERWSHRLGSDSLAIERFLKFYIRDGYCMKTPKKFRIMRNRKRKAKFKQIMYNAMKHDSFDNVVTMRWHNDARHRYY
jgi:hypothetical protein